MKVDSANETIGMNIKRLRKKLKMTQAELGQKTLIERATICKYEKGTLVPTADNLEKIEKELKQPKGSLMKKVAIAIPDTSALLRNKRLLNLLLEDYSKIIITDVVIMELSRFKNLKMTQHSSGQEKRQKRIASQIMSMIDEYLVKYKGKVVVRDTKKYDICDNRDVSENDRRIVELAKSVKKETSRAVDIIHIDKDYPLFADDSVNQIYLEDYMARRSEMEENYQIVLDLDKEFRHLERYSEIAGKINLNAFLPDGMTLLISCIRCNEPEKINERGGIQIPEGCIRKKMIFLLEHGANPDKTDSNHYCHTPLEHCIERHQPDFDEFCILLRYKADYNKCSVDETQPGHKRLSEINEGNTPLMIACFLGREKYVKKLCSMPDICVNSQDCNGYTPLIKCAVARWNRRNQGGKCEQYERIYKFLKDKMHADPLIRDRNNMTAQDWWEKPTEEEDDD